MPPHATLSGPSGAMRAPERFAAGPAPGVRLGRYELLLSIAHGGMAEVWVARQLGDLGFSRLVAVKTMRRELAREPGFRRMFFDEASIASRIRHTNVVEVLDLGEDGSTVYLAMALIEGHSLRDLMQSWHERRPGQGLPGPIAVRVLTDVLGGLHAAHELADDHGVLLQVVHRDVSPHNILVGIDGVSKVSDFGVAKALGRFADETDAGQLKGKVGYVSPEQLQRRPLDRRADVCAAGIVFWELLTGKRLFHGEDAIDTLGRIAIWNVPDPRRVRPDVPDPVAEVAMRALARDRDLRFASAAEMRQALEATTRSVGPMASAIEVAAFVSEVASADIEERRRAIRSAARGRFEPAPPSDRHAFSLRRSIDVAESPGAASSASGITGDATPLRRWSIATSVGVLASAGMVAAGLAHGTREKGLPTPLQDAFAPAESVVPSVLMLTPTEVEQLPPADAVLTASSKPSAPPPTRGIPSAAPRVPRVRPPYPTNPYGR